MNPLTISFNAAAAPDLQPSIFFQSDINITSRSRRRYRSCALPVIVKQEPAPFAVALAHEVRNPLANINLSVEMLGSLVKDNDLKIYVDIIMRSSNRINELIKEFLQCQQQEDVQPSICSVHQLLDDALEMGGDRLKLKNIHICKDYAPQDGIILMNRSKMKIALTNIIINAIEAMPSEKGVLTLVTKSMGGRYVIQIEDNGCGISKENLKNISRPFFTSKPGGLGIGLATTYHILRSENVTVEVESEEGNGTRFILLLPFLPAKQDV